MADSQQRAHKGNHEANPYEEIHEVDEETGEIFVSIKRRPSPSPSSHAAMAYELDGEDAVAMTFLRSTTAVDVASSDGSRVVRKGVGLRAGGDDADGGGGGVGGVGALFALKAVRISATFPNLTWRFRQKQFPFLEAEGRARRAASAAPSRTATPQLTAGESPSP